MQRPQTHTQIASVSLNWVWKRTKNKSASDRLHTSSNLSYTKTFPMQDTIPTIHCTHHMCTAQFSFPFYWNYTGHTFLLTNFNVAIVSCIKMSLYDRIWCMHSITAINLQHFALQLNKALTIDHLIALWIFNGFFFFHKWSRHMILPFLAY